MFGVIAVQSRLEASERVLGCRNSVGEVVQWPCDCFPFITVPGDYVNNLVELVVATTIIHTDLS